MLNVKADVHVNNPPITVTATVAQASKEKHQQRKKNHLQIVQTHQKHIWLTQWQLGTVDWFRHCC